MRFAEGYCGPEELAVVVSVDLGNFCELVCGLDAKREYCEFVVDYARQIKGVGNYCKRSISAFLDEKSVWQHTIKCC